MRKLFKLLFCLLMLQLTFSSCTKVTNFHNENLNEHICGSWNIEDGQHVEFFEEGYFELNDTIYGNYWVNETDTTLTSYICMDEDSVSIMKLLDANVDHDILTVYNLPKHQGKTIKMIKTLK